MGALIRFVAAIALFGLILSVYRAGIPMPPWLAAIILVAGLILLLRRGNLARKMISILGAMIVLLQFWRDTSTVGLLIGVGLLAMVFLGVAVMFRGPWAGRY